MSACPYGIECEWDRAYGADCGRWTAYYEDGTVHIRTFHYGDWEHGPLCFLTTYPTVSRLVPFILQGG